ncbi:Hint domain-containing protein [Shimia biformata]|uniref:Hint domain-containing protein n=1 Tax=Shimia biformata TaxID=1294299 RepID=UPI00194ECE23|nr:Hint domain-containing protein [Shimia biformata]
MGDLTYYARFDSNSANNPALNLTGDPAILLTFSGYDIDGNDGDLNLDKPGPDQADPDTVVVIDGTAYEFVFELSGTLPTQKKDGSQQVPDQFEGDPVVIITILDYPTVGTTSRLAFLPGQDASQTEMDAFGNGAIDIQSVSTSPGPTPVCFRGGTHILTLNGECLVEDLRPGDLVQTVDHGPVPVLWITGSRFSAAALRFNADLRPVCIPKGSFDPATPHRDLWLSPQHRIVLAGYGVELVSGHDEAFASARHVMEHRTQRGSDVVEDVVYYHMLLPAHAVVLSEGLATESFFPGPQALRHLSGDARAELEQQFPQWCADEGAYGPMARPVLTQAEVRSVLNIQWSDFQAA